MEEGQQERYHKWLTIPLHPGALRYYREAGVPGIEEFAKSVEIKQHATRLIGRVAHLYWLDRILIP